MNAKKSCPCCSNSMLRHLSNRHSYWYCRSCRIEMPHIDLQKIVNQKAKVQLRSTPIKSIVSPPIKVKTIMNF